MVNIEHAPDIEVMMRISRQTPKAIYAAPVLDEYNNVWLPKSQIDIVPNKYGMLVAVQMARTLAKEKGILYEEG